MRFLTWFILFLLPLGLMAETFGGNPKCNRNPVLTTTNNVTTRDIAPLLTTHWGQGQYYNSLCPEDSLLVTGHYQAGSVAVALAQIVRYWEHPIVGDGEHYYYLQYVVRYNANFAYTPYQWEDMPDSLHQENDQIARLIYHMAVVSHTNWAASGSSGLYAPIVQNMKDHLTYNNSTNSSAISLVYKRDYTNAAWNNLLIQQLSNGYPVFYAAANQQMSSHSFVVDGYDQENGLFHCNMGWLGVDDGWYDLNQLQIMGSYFTAEQAAIVNLYPAPQQNQLPPPRYAQAAFTDSTITISWQPPLESDYTLTGYQLYRGNTLLQQYNVADTLRYVMYPEHSGQYSFKINAIYVQDPGSSLPICTTLTRWTPPPDIPVPPSNLQIQMLANGQARLSWSYPPPGEYPILGYRLYLNDVYVGYTLDNSHYTYTGLQDQAAYTAAIGAVYQDIGESELVELGFTYTDPNTLTNDANSILTAPLLGEPTPNPFNPHTELSFYLPVQQSVKITIYSINGKRVNNLVDGVYTKGWHQIVFNGTDNRQRPLAAGIYLYRMQTANNTQTKKMLLLK